MSIDFQQGNQDHLMGRIVFSTNRVGMAWYPQAKREVDPYLIPYTNTKWIKNLNVKTKTIKFLKENIKMNIHIFWFGNHFLYTMTKAQATKRIKKEKLDFKKNCASIVYYKRPPTEQKKRSANNISGIDWLHRT